MSRSKEELAKIAQLGSKSTQYVYDYDPKLLERFENKHPSDDYMVMLNCPEFTSLCPKTGQPDFAEIRIAYIPDHYLVESKSLKLYLFSFRNHGDFHEDCCNIIRKLLFIYTKWNRRPPSQNLHDTVQVHLRYRHFQHA